MISNFKLAIVIILMLNASSIYAQKSELYKGNYNIEDIGSGEAEYYYQIKRKDTIFTGAFTFSKYIDRGNKQIIDYKGNFKQNRLNGKWEFSYKKIDSVGKQKADGFNILSQTSGEEFQLLANFKNDQQADEWSLIKRNYVNSRPKDAFYQSTITFDDKHIKRSFKASNSQFDVEADFNSSGLLEGELVIKHKKKKVRLKEVRVYNEGALEKHYFEIDSQKVFIDYLGLDQSKAKDQETWVSMPLNKEYTDVLQLANISTYQFDKIDDELDILSHKSSVFISEALKEFYSYNSIDIWQSFYQEDLRNNAEVSLKKYPLTSQEKKAVQQIKNDFEFITKTIDEFKGNKLTEIGIYQNKKLNKTLRIVDLITSKKPQLKENVDMLQSDAISFLDRSQFDSSIFTDVRFPEEVEFDFKNETVEEKTKLPTSFKVDNFQLADYASYIEKIRDRIDELNQSAQKIINKLLKQSRLNEIEEELIAKKDRIIKLYKKQLKKGEFNDYHQETANSVIGFTKKEFQDYATQDIDEKKESIDRYLNCYDNVLSLYEMQKELPAKIDRLKELYTRTVWNPYTYSDMDEIVKKRIYNAYEEILLPVILNQINSEINCKDIPKNIKNFNKLYNRMVEIRDLDTKKLERELRRKDNPEVIFQLLSIEYIR